MWRRILRYGRRAATWPALRRAQPLATAVVFCNVWSPAAFSAALSRATNGLMSPKPTMPSELMSALNHWQLGQAS